MSEFVTVTEVTAISRKFYTSVLCKTSQEISVTSVTVTKLQERSAKKQQYEQAIYVLELAGASSLAQRSNREIGSICHSKGNCPTRGLSPRHRGGGAAPGRRVRKTSHAVRMPGWGVEGRAVTGKLTERQRKELRKVAKRGYYSGGIIGYAIYQKLLKRGYLEPRNVKLTTKEGEYTIGIIEWTGLRDVLTDKARKALQVHQ